jgi:hypothetical protein
MRKNISRKTILKETGTLLIAAIIGLNTLFVFTPTSVEAKAIIQPENTETATFNSTASDGFISKVASTYNTARNANEGIVESFGITLIIGQVYQWPFYTISRSFVFFDTSSLPNTATIQSAVLSLYGNLDLSSSDFSIVVQNGQPFYPHIPLLPTDYNKDHYSGMGGSFDTNYFITGGYNDIHLNNDGISWINKHGTTKLCLRSSRDINDNIPVTLESVSVDSAEGLNRPKLTVEYKTARSNINLGESAHIGKLSVGNINPQTSINDVSMGISKTLLMHFFERHSSAFQILRQLLNM